MNNFNSDMIYVALFLAIFLILLGLIKLVDIISKTKYICSIFNLHEKSTNNTNKNFYECSRCGTFVVIEKIKDRKGR